MNATVVITVPQWGTVTLIEAIWLASGLVAFALSLRRLPALLDDYRFAQMNQEDDLYVIARGYLRRELVRVLQAGAVISIGVYAAIQPSPVPGPAKITLVGLWLTATLISISVLVALQSYLDWRDREKVNRIIGGSQ